MSTQASASGTTRFSSINDPSRKAALEEIYLDLKNMGRYAPSHAADRLVFVGENLATFSASELARYLDPLGSAAAMEREAGKRVPFLSILRNLIVLLPLILTWIGLALVAPNLDSKGSLSTLTTIAVLDVALFLLLIFIGILADSASRQARRQSQIILEKLDSAVRLLSEEVASYPNADPRDPGQWAKIVQQQLDQVRQVLTSVSTAISGVTRATDTVATQMQSFQANANTLGASATTLATEARGLAGAVQGIQGAVAGVDAAAKSMRQETAALASVQANTNTLLKQAEADMQKASAAMDNVAGAMSANIQKASDDLKRTTELLFKIEKSMRDYVGKVYGNPGPLSWLWPWNWFRRQPKQPRGGRATSGQAAQPPPGQPTPNSRNVP